VVVRVWMIGRDWIKVMGISWVWVRVLCVMISVHNYRFGYLGTSKKIKLTNNIIIINYRTLLNHILQIM